MDTLGVCGAPSIAADNGVVMVKEPRAVGGGGSLKTWTLPGREVVRTQREAGLRRAAVGAVFLDRGSLDVTPGGCRQDKLVTQRSEATTLRSARAFEGCLSPSVPSNVPFPELSANGAASRGLAVRRSVLSQPLYDLMQISPRFHSNDKVECIRWLSIANLLQGFYPPVGSDGTGFEWSGVLECL